MGKEAVSPSLQSKTEHCHSKSQAELLHNKGVVYYTKLTKHLKLHFFRENTNEGRFSLAWNNLLSRCAWKQRPDPEELPR